LPRLRRYGQKRDFKKTAEPPHKAGASARKGKQLIFVVQKHAARRLHWDFRLEWEGTLRSWAVPKGPSLDPADKRLAVEVEDHPIEYAKFSGDIPKGQYGGGHVDIWDNGTWEPVGDFKKQLGKGTPRVPAAREETERQVAPGAHAHAGQTAPMAAHEEP
jgi:bifunctional non-homologous end joining protein LigD